MKYIGYILFLLIFICIFFLESAKVFFFDSFKLAPEITVLVSVCYIYIVLLTTVVSLFPQVFKDPISIYDTHVKMTCSVMVSLGLVGTFLGLVDMISGIATALSGDENDFGKRMASLLGAISTSLGAMSFAFMTSILGVGVSAYALVAATFVSTSLTEAKKVNDEHLKQDKETNNTMLDQNLNSKGYREIVSPILERIDTLEEKREEKAENTGIEIASPINNELLERMQNLEEKFLHIDMERFENEFTPVAIIDNIIQHHKILEAHNEILTDSILQLNRNHISLVQALDSLSSNLTLKSNSVDDQYKILHELNITMVKNNSLLHKIDHSANEIKLKASHGFEKLKHIFE